MARDGLVQKSFRFDGKRIFVYGKTEREVIEKMAVMKAKLEEGRVVYNRSTRVADWIDTWISTYKEGKVNDRWLKDIRAKCDNYIVPAIGHEALSNVKPLQLQNIFKCCSNLSQSSNSKLYDILSQIFETAQANRLIEYNPMSTVEKPKGTGSEARRSITEYERKLTLEVAEYHRGGLFVLIMLYCGLRPQEIIPLQWCDIDFERKRIRIYKALKSDGLVKPFTKTAAGKRDVPIPSVLLGKLQAVQKSGQYSPFDLVCPNTRGERLSSTSCRDLWLNFKREMNIRAGCKVFRNQLVPPLPIAEDLTLYCYRHTYCTDLQDAGVPINVAKELMGHSSIEVTSKIYTHRSEISTDHAAELIDQLIQLRSEVQ